MKKQLIGLIIMATALFPGCSNMIDDFSKEKTWPLPGTLSINNNDTLTTSASVTLSIDVPDAEKMRFSNDRITWSAWETYGAAKNWVLESGHEEKTVYAEFRNSKRGYGRIHDSIIPVIEERFTASDGVSGDYMGGFNYGIHGSLVSVSADGNTIVVGCWQKNTVKGCAYVYRKSESGWTEYILSASDGVANEGFGFSVRASADGNTIIIGAWLDDEAAGTDVGSAYAFKWNGDDYEEIQKITASDGAAGDQYALCTTISHDGQTLVLGSYRDDVGSYNNAGSAYVYRWNAESRKFGVWNEASSHWDENNKLTASDIASNDVFGWHVALSADGNMLIVGAFNGYGNAANSGSAYIYTWNGSAWIEREIYASDGAAGDAFGRYVALSDDGAVAVVGAYRDEDPTYTDCGAAYVYRFNGTDWTESKLTASDRASNDYYGYSVATTGTGSMVIVGSIDDTVGSNTQQGSAYIYEWDGAAYNETLHLAASDGAIYDFFGYSLDVSDTGILVVSAPGKTIGSNSAQGCFYIY